MENKTGEVQTIRKDRKAIAIENVWYSSSFQEIPEDINKGDIVELTFSQKGLFKNIKNIKKSNNLKEVPKAIPCQEETKELILTSTDKNCILMKSIDIYLDKDNLKSLEECIDLVKKIRLNI
jgi:hypothetical protein